VCRKCPLWVEKPPQHYAGENVRFDISMPKAAGPVSAHPSHGCLAPIPVTGTGESSTSARKKTAVGGLNGHELQHGAGDTLSGSPHM
jgi:hypothetical protein